MTPFRLTISLNGVPQTVDVDPDCPLLWVLRDELGLTGAKYGCGKGLCGACTVHVDSTPVRSCLVSARDVHLKSITTIEGISDAHPVVAAWINEDVSQCGYCQPGQIMSAIALLKRSPSPTDSDIEEAMVGNLCRCGTYPRICKAIKVAAQSDTRQTQKKAKS